MLLSSDHNSCNLSSQTCSSHRKFHLLSVSQTRRHIAANFLPPFLSKCVTETDWSMCSAPHPTLPPLCPYVHSSGSCKLPHLPLKREVKNSPYTTVKVGQLSWTGREYGGQTEREGVWCLFFICKDFICKDFCNITLFSSEVNAVIACMWATRTQTHTQHAVIRKAPHVQTSPSASSNSFWGLQESNRLHHILLKAFITQRDTQRAAGTY